MTQDILVWTGAAVWLALGVIGLRIVWDVLCAFARAASWIRWRLACIRTHRIAWKPTRLPSALLRRWLEELTDPSVGGTHTFRSKAGEWRGYGDWTVHPADSSKL